MSGKWEHLRREFNSDAPQNRALLNEFLEEGRRLVEAGLLDETEFQTIEFFLSMKQINSRSQVVIDSIERIIGLLEKEAELDRSA